MLDSGFAGLRWMFPVLLLCGLLEGAVFSRRRPGSFDWREYRASLAIAIGNRVIGLLTRGLLFAALMWVWQHRLFTVPLKTWWGLALLFLFEELSYYWEHRLNHRSRWFWASHAVHHSPTQLRLSAAYRLSWTGTISGSWLCFVPMVLLGFHPAAIGAMLAINLLYQFWLHNEWVPKLGVVEWIFNTPSHHRVHHASNAQYLDRNYGGILIVFDRLFGTFAEENEVCRYGLVHPVGSNNPFRIVFFEWINLLRDVAAARGWRKRLGFAFGPPGWAPKRSEPEEATRPAMFEGVV
jgi:sterol desaturase/sphingolipid hydroxylase (fatty acid hydroxylase superfamily)